MLGFNSSKAKLKLGVVLFQPDAVFFIYFGRLYGPHFPHALSHHDIMALDATIVVHPAAQNRHLRGSGIWLVGLGQAESTGPCVTSRLGIVAGYVALPQSPPGIAHETIPGPR